MSYDGATRTGRPVISESVADQCRVEGSYYCSDGAWKKRDAVTGAGSIELKTAPMGAELLGNTFGGN